MHANTKGLVFFMPVSLLPWVFYLFEDQGVSELRIDQTVPLLLKASQPEQGKKNGASKFEQVLQGYMEEVNKLQLNTEQLDRQLATGTLENIHEATIAAEKAALALELTIQIRNKVVEAYQEIMRMPI